MMEPDIGDLVLLTASFSEDWPQGDYGVIVDRGRVATFTIRLINPPFNSYAFFSAEFRVMIKRFSLFM